MPRDQTQPGYFSREREEPGNEVGCKAVIVVWFRTLLYTYSQKVWAENSVFFESSRGLNILTTDHYNYVSRVTKINKFVHIECLMLWKVLEKYSKFDL